MINLQTVNLTKNFGELVAVDQVNLSVESGEFRSVIGPNGAGKTTLFNCITGALQPSEGRVLLNDEDITDSPSHERVRKGIGRSFQITNIFGGLSALENVRLAAQAIPSRELKMRTRLFRQTSKFEDLTAQARDVLDQIGLSEHAETRASTLAYGDQRRLEIGLVLATEPDIVLLDEPTAGMSTEETEATMKLVDEVLADQTLLLIEHDIDLVMDVSDRITVLNQGDVITTGTPEEVASNDEVQEAYLGGAHA